MTYDKENRLATWQTGIIVASGFTSNAMSKLSTSPDAGPVLWDGEDYQCEWPLPHPISPPKNYTVYHVVNGIMLGATDTNNARFDYLVDVLGSVTGQTDSTGASVGTYRWKPYGSSLSTSGVASGRFGWTGNTGSRAIGLSFTEQYNRNRYFSTTTKQWTTRDILWPDELPYGYVGGRVVSAIDPLGLWCFRESGGALPEAPAIGRVLRDISMNPGWSDFLECIQPTNCQYPQTLGDTGALLGDISKKLGSCDNPDFEIIWGEGGWWPFTNVCNDEKTCMWTDFRSRPPRIHICQKKALKPNCGPLLCQLIHELIHAIGIIHTGDSTAFDCVNKLAGCEDFKPYTSRTAKGGASRTDQSQSK